MRRAKNSPSSWLAVIAVLALHGALLAAVIWGKTPGRSVELDGEVISVQFFDTPRPAGKSFTDAKPNDPKPVQISLPPTLPVFSGLTGEAELPPRSLPSQAITPVTEPVPAPMPDKSHDESLRRYGALIWQQIMDRKPSGIHRSGQALITFRLNTQGQILSLSLTLSSGDALLDAQALATIKAAAPFPPPPADLRPEELAFTIPFDFS